MDFHEFNFLLNIINLYDSSYNDIIQIGWFDGITDGITNFLAKGAKLLLGLMIEYLTLIGVLFLLLGLLMMIPIFISIIGFFKGMGFFFRLISKGWKMTKKIKSAAKKVSRR